MILNGTSFVLVWHSFFSFCDYKAGNLLTQCVHPGRTSLFPQIPYAGILAALCPVNCHFPGYVKGEEAELTHLSSSVLTGSTSLLLHCTQQHHSRKKKTLIQKRGLVGLEKVSINLSWAWIPRHLASHTRDLQISVCSPIHFPEWHLAFLTYTWKSHFRPGYNIADQYLDFKLGDIPQLCFQILSE